MDAESATQRGVSISTSFDYDVPVERQLALIEEAGFTHISLGAREAHSGYLSKVSRSRLKALVQRHSLWIDSIHGPQADQPGGIELLSAVAEAAADLGAPVVVVHGGPFAFEETELPARLERLLDVCETLHPVAARTGIVFALENVLPGPATDLIRQTLPRLDPRAFGFCYDSAHDQIGGPRPLDLLAELSDRTVAVHLSDRIREFIDHVIRGEGFIDWETLAEMLRKSRFAGPLLLEVMVTHSAEKETRRFLELARRRGGQLCDRVFR